MTQEQLIANQRRNLLIFATRHSVTEACRVFGVSRTSFYKIKQQLVQTGSLQPRQRRRPRMPNETRLSVKKELLKIVQKDPARGSPFYAYQLRRKGIHISSQGVWYCLKRFGLNSRYKRLVYLETLATEGQPLTERTVRQLKRKFSQVLHGRWPGHVVALDTFYVGTLKSVGRIYQITGIDLCSRFGLAQLYCSKESDSAVDFVERTLIPTFFANNVQIESILTDNGKEFVNAEFQQLLSDYDIVHHRTPKGKPICNGYCERFQRTILEECYQVIFRKKYFSSLAELQHALSDYTTYYNFERVHFGCIKTGAIPADILKSRVSVLRQRFHDLLT